MAATKSAYPSLEERVQEVLSSYEVQRIVDGVYSMRHPEKQEVYTVDVTKGTCTCPAGQKGKPCKHLAAAKKLEEEKERKDEEAYAKAIEILYWVAEAGEEKLLDLSDRRKARVMKALATVLLELCRSVSAAELKALSEKLFG